jgi:hypothetical protein
LTAAGRARGGTGLHRYETDRATHEAPRDPVRVVMVADTTSLFCTIALP